MESENKVINSEKNKQKVTNVKKIELKKPKPLETDRVNYTKKKERKIKES